MDRLSSSANIFHVLVDFMKKDFWYVILYLRMRNLIFALLDDLVGLVTRISGRAEDFNWSKSNQNLKENKI